MNVRKGKVWFMITDFGYAISITQHFCHGNSCMTDSKSIAIGNLHQIFYLFIWGPDKHSKTFCIIFLRSFHVVAARDPDNLGDFFCRLCIGVADSTLGRSNPKKKLKSPWRFPELTLLKCSRFAAERQDLKVYIYVLC